MYFVIRLYCTSGKPYAWKAQNMTLCDMEKISMKRFWMKLAICRLTEFLGLLLLSSFRFQLPKLVRLLWFGFLVDTLGFLFFALWTIQTWFSSLILLLDILQPLMEVGTRYIPQAWICSMLCFPGRSVMLCWHSNFWSCFFSLEQCLLRHSFPIPHRFNPACFYTGELIGIWFRLWQRSFISICSEHCPFFFPCSKQSICIKSLKGAI